MSRVSAINTYYNGYRFRSRLEARWAIFFDQMGMTYLHEPEGFDLGDLKYLPDFLLPEGVKLYGEDDPFPNVWIEVKPSLELEKDDRHKIAEFVQRTDNVVLILSGDPQPDARIKLIAHKANGGEWLTHTVTWVELSNGELGLLDSATAESVSHPETRAAIERLSRTPRLMQAYALARQERFEHGETPSVQPFKQERNCESCGKLFTPSQPFHKFCYECYSEERSKTATSTVARSVESGTDTLVGPTPSTRSRTWIYGLIGVIIITLIVTAGLVFVSRDRVNAAGETPNSGLQKHSPLGGDSPASAPVRSIDLEAAPACECTENLYDCGDFETHTAAQACFDACYPQSGDVHFLDANADGEACERLP